MRKIPTPEEYEKLGSYLIGTVAQAWERCLPIWLNSPWRDESYALGGRVNDFPPGLRRTHYLTSLESALGRRFVHEFAADYLFILKRFENGLPAEQICAYDLLTFLAVNAYCNHEPLANELRNCHIAVPPQIRAELEDDNNYSDDLKTYTLGEILTFMHEEGG